MSNQVIHANVGFQVLTPSGYQQFSGVAYNGERPTRIITTCEYQLRGTLNHPIRTDRGIKLLDEIQLGDLILTQSGYQPVLEIANSAPTKVYDLLDVEGGHLYYTNGIVSHNCKFLSSDALLIDSRKLLEMKSQPALKEYRDFKFWAPIYPENAYVVTVDPATGSGSDYSVIDVYHFPTLEQVAQLRTNDLHSHQLYARLKWVLKGLENKMCDVYFTIENNGVGEGLIALYEADENPPLEAVFVGDETKRPGMSTLGRSKLRSCVMYKELIESDRVKINSEQTILELKTFVRKAGSYQAQVGATDDCVSAGLLLGRVLNEISAYEEDAFDTMYRVNDEGEVYHIADLEPAGLTSITFS